MLTGLIGLFERGSIVQSVRNPHQQVVCNSVPSRLPHACTFSRIAAVQFVATVLSFVFFALTVRAMPYKNPVFNAVKIFTEFQICMSVSLARSSSCAPQSCGARSHVACG
jgi:hypothetical protein